MLTRLGIKHVAYDWRAKHVPEFEQEILEYKKHGVNYFAFWSWHESMEPLIRKHKIHPQIWMMMRNSDKPTQQEKVGDAVAGLLPMVVVPGSGSELYRGVGAVVLGGLTLATALTLFVVPSFFALVWRFRVKDRSPA